MHRDVHPGHRRQCSLHLFFGSGWQPVVEATRPTHGSTSFHTMDDAPWSATRTLSCATRTYRRRRCADAVRSCGTVHIRPRCGSCRYRPMQVSRVPTYVWRWNVDVWQGMVIKHPRCTGSARAMHRQRQNGVMPNWLHVETRYMCRTHLALPPWHTRCLTFHLALLVRLAAP